jgi:hypothetical protein
LRTTFRLCLVAAVVAAIGLVAVPAASATTGAQGHASITKFEKKQNKRIKKAKKKAAKAHARIENLKAWSFDLDAHNRRQDTSFFELLGTVNAIVAGVPDIVGGLQALQSALEDSVAPALTALGDGLTTLGAAYQAVEYGAAKGTITLPAGCGGTTSLTPALVSADIPDDGNPATTSGSVPLNVAACPAVAGNITLDMVGAIRSNESDGAATGDPAGQAGGLMVINCATGPCADGAGAAKDPGEMVCSAVTPNSTFDLPDGSQTSQPLVNIQEGDDRLASDQPVAGDVDILGASSCAVKGGAVYMMVPTIQFVDIPTSLDPGPTD